MRCLAVPFGVAAVSAAITAAVAVIGKDTARSFLQTGGPRALPKLALGKPEVIDVCRLGLFAFLPGKQHAGHAPLRGEIVSILKWLGDSFAKGNDSTQCDAERFWKSGGVTMNLPACERMREARRFDAPE